MIIRAGDIHIGGIFSMGFDGHYFGPGPSPLPGEVSEAFLKKHLEIGDLSLKMYELSHRSSVSSRQIEGIFEKIRKLFLVPDDYEVLLVSGGARHQYEQFMMNFSDQMSIGFFETGLFSKSWSKTGRLVSTDANIYDFDINGDWNQRKNGFSSDELICMVSNETADGVMLPLDFDHDFLINDATSDLGFRQFDINRYAMVFAAMGKAFHASGMSIVMISKDLLSLCRKDLLPLQSYVSISESGSMYATPSMICLDLFECVLDWMIVSGGISVLEARLAKRSERIYDLLDAYPVYNASVPKRFRSLHNIVFQLPKGQLERFVGIANKRKLYGLCGHRLVGGGRINLYHGVSDQTFSHLCDFLVDYGKMCLN